MIVNKKEAKLIESCIKNWLEKGYIDASTAARLNTSYQIKEAKKQGFDWKNLSLIAFFFSVMCILLSTILFISDKWLMGFVDALVDTSDILKVIFFILLSKGLYYWAFFRKKKYPGRIYSNEALFMFGSVSLAFAMTYLSFVLHLEEGGFPILILLTTVIFGVVGISLYSSLTWYLALVAFAIWFGTETGYLSGWDTHFWGMNYPLRYVFFGLFLLFLSSLFQRFSRTSQFVRSTFATGLVGLFFSFWLLSIFGNYGDWDTWAEVSQWRFIFWVLILGTASIVAIYYGLKKDDRVAREIGVVFLLLNIYTRYFEYFWDSLHKVVFFIVLAASFWIIGKKAENIWHLTEKNLAD